MDNLTVIVIYKINTKKTTKLPLFDKRFLFY